LLDVVLLALKAGILILLFVFVWLVMRGAARDVVSGEQASTPLGDRLPEPPSPSRAVPDATPAPPPVTQPPVERVVPVSPAVEEGLQMPADAGPFAAAPPPAAVAAAASAVAESAAADSASESTPEERRVRREARAKERTLAGERLDFSSVINPRLVVEQSPVLEVGTRYPLEGWVMIGRSPASDIVLSDSFVSSTHARLVPRGQLYFVEDLGSTNGTFVDGREVKEAQLKPDSRLRIGETTFRYEE
jgi:hypothetical protein